MKKIYVCIILLFAFLATGCAKSQNNQLPNTVPTMDCSAMYTQCNVTPITRKTQQWENTYTQPNPSQLPVANWTQYIPNPQQASGPVYPTPAPPTVPSVTPDTSWESIAKQNFPNK